MPLLASLTFHFSFLTMTNLLFTLVVAASTVVAAPNANAPESCPTAISEASFDPAYTFTLTMVDGTTAAFETTLSQADRVALELDAAYDVASCTAKIKGWDNCSVTASNCKSARAGRDACACAEGLDVLC